MFEMKLKLLDKYEAAITELCAWSAENTIYVFLTLDQSVGGYKTIGVSIEAKDYTEELFLDTIRVQAETDLTEIIRKDIEDSERSRKRAEHREALNKLVAGLGNKFGIDCRLKDW